MKKIRGWAITHEGEPEIVVLDSETARVWAGWNTLVPVWVIPRRQIKKRKSKKK